MMRRRKQSDDQHVDESCFSSSSSTSTTPNSHFFPFKYSSTFSNPITNADTYTKPHHQQKQQQSFFGHHQNPLYFSSCCFIGAGDSVGDSCSTDHHHRKINKKSTADSPPPFSNDYMSRFGSNLPPVRKKRSDKQNKETLESEVSVLRKMLNQEEKTHEILDYVQSQENSSSICIPKFLPVKAKELLAELAMVEGEITHLETQITKTKLELKHEKETTSAIKLKESKSGILYKLTDQSTSTINHFPPPSPLNNKSGKVGFETKALHFISKAIKGDYPTLPSQQYSLYGKLNDGKPRNVSFYDQKDNSREDIKVQERSVSRKSGLILKSPSPLRDPRHPSPKMPSRSQQRDVRNPEKSMELHPKPLSSTLPTQENIQNWNPNKLSENIMKCLNFIYVRLLRTSRAVELEKSGPISRTMLSSTSSRNIKVDANLNSTKQQDPFGVFYMEESLPRDIGPYKNMVIFTSASMDPKCISSSTFVTLIRKLRVLMNNLQTVDLKILTSQQKLAFWINMYNACIMHGFLQYGVPNTPELMTGFIKKATLNIGGNTLTAEAIEHYVLSKSTTSIATEVFDKVEKGSAIHKLYGLESVDPNVIFALTRGTRSSPAVRIYTGEGVIGELERSKLEYLQASIMVTSTSTKRIGLPELLLQNTADLECVVEWVCHQLPTSCSLRKSIVDYCFRGHTTNNNNSISISSSKVSVEKIPYDFEFQYLLPM